MIIKNKKKNLLLVLACVILVLIAVITFTLVRSFAYTGGPIYSTNPSYENNEPGAFAVTNEATWTDMGELKVTPKIESIASTEYNSHDVVIMIGRYNSSLYQMKRDAINYITEKLEEGNYRFAIVSTDGTTASLVVDFNNDLTTLKNAVNNITYSSSYSTYYTSYSVVSYFETMLYNYEYTPGTSIHGIMLGYYNYYSYQMNKDLYPSIKASYPYFYLSVLNYASPSSSSYEPSSYNYYFDQYFSHKNYSYTTNMFSLLKDVPAIYNNFSIEYTFNSEYFEVDESKVQSAVFSLEDDKLNATLSLNYYFSGTTNNENAIYLKLKEEYIDSYLDLNLIPNIDINYTIGSVTDSINSTSGLPISTYAKVSYVANNPEDCEVVGDFDDTSDELIYHTIEFPTTKLTCGDYTFKGWGIKTTESEAIQLNDDYYIMPDEDIEVFGKWEKLSLNLGTDGNVVDEAKPIMQSRNTTVNKSNFWNYTSSVVRLIFEDEVRPIQDVVYSFDISEAQNGTVMAYLVYNKDSTYYYDAYIQADGKVVAPKDMSRFFYNWYYLKEVVNLENLDTSNTTDMSYFFEQMRINDSSTHGLTGFDWNKIDTSNVTTMKGMFKNATFKAVNIDGLDMSNVEDMSYMFANIGYYADYGTKFSLDVSGIYAPKATKADHLFSEYSSSIYMTFLNVSNFYAPNVTDFSNMFGGSSSYAFEHLTYIDFSNWTALNAENLSRMFYGLVNVEVLDFSNSTIKNVKDTSYMFSYFGYDSSYTSNLVLNLNSFDMSELTNMSNMFYYSWFKSVDMSSWETPKLKEVKEAFYYMNCEYLNIEKMDFSNVENFENLFYGFSYMYTYSDLYKIGYSEEYSRNVYKKGVIKFPEFNTSSATNFKGMFEYINASIKDIDFTKFDTSKVTNFDYMLENSSSIISDLTYIDVATWDMSSAESLSYMFAYHQNLKSLDLSSWDVSNVKNMNSLVSGCSSLTYFNFDNWDTSNVTSMGSLFSGTALEKIDINHLDTSSVTDIYGLFSYNTSLKEVLWDNIDTSKITSIASLFNGCTSLESIELGHLDTSNVTSFSYMFRSCLSLSSLDVSNFNTSKAYSFNYMFAGLESLKELNLSNFDVSNAKEFEGMFEGSSKLVSLDLSSFNTSIATEMANMFYGCSNLETLIVPNLTAINAIDISGMFSGCKSLKELNLDNFELSNKNKLSNSYFGTKKYVYNLSYLFNDCISLQKLSMANFITNDVEVFDYMFNNCESLVELNIPYLNFESATSMNYMFNNTRKIKTTINSTHYPNLGSAVTENVLTNSATDIGSEMIVKYIPDNKESAEKFVSYKTAGANVILGDQIELYNITIVGDSDLIASTNLLTDVKNAYRSQKVTISLNDGRGLIKSFKVNGELVESTQFIMPSEDVVITDVDFVRTIVFESDHYSYSAYSLSYDKDFGPDCKSIKVTLVYEMSSVAYQKYTTLTISNYKKYYSETTTPFITTYQGSYGQWDVPVMRTVELIVPDNHLYINFRPYTAANYYGFKAYIEPIYE